MSSTDTFAFVCIAQDNPLASGSEGLRSFIEALDLHLGEPRPATVEGVERPFRSRVYAYTHSYGQPTQCSW